MSRRDEGGSPKSDAAAARSRLAAVAFVASLLGHRARNQLATIRAALELLNAGMEANMPPEYRATLLREMDALVGDFNLGIDAIRGEFGCLERMPAREAIDEVLREFAPSAERAGVRLERRFDPAGGTVLADAGLLRLVLLNLLRNSLQALGGVAAPVVAVSTESAGGRCAVEVEDNGPGVAAGLRARLFVEPVTGWGGTGLGLVLCRDAMTVMGGTIRLVKMSKGNGARFRADFAD
jgi:C4-dicarboxylate-specific signal transduction histidine kinase